MQSQLYGDITLGFGFECNAGYFNESGSIFSSTAFVHRLKKLTVVQLYCYKGNPPAPEKKPRNF